MLLGNEILKQKAFMLRLFEKLYLFFLDADEVGCKKSKSNPFYDFLREKNMISSFSFDILLCNEKGNLMFILNKIVVLCQQTEIVSFNFCLNAIFAAN